MYIEDLFINVKGQQIYNYARVAYEMFWEVCVVLNGRIMKNKTELTEINIYSLLINTLTIWSLRQTVMTIVTTILHYEQKLQVTK